MITEELARLQGLYPTVKLQSLTDCPARITSGIEQMSGILDRVGKEISGHQPGIATQLLSQATLGLNQVLELVETVLSADQTPRAADQTLLLESSEVGHLLDEAKRLGASGEEYLPALKEVRGALAQAEATRENRADPLRSLQRLRLA